MKKPKKTARRRSTARETPVRVIVHKSGSHLTETRIFAREIHEHFCIQPGCQFFGRRAVQGVCHTTETFTGSSDWRYIDAMIAGGTSYVEELEASMKRQKITPKEKLELVKNHLACAWSNSISTMDELVRLRRNVRLLEEHIRRIADHETKKAKKS